MQENFDKAFNDLCEMEGYKSNLVGDPGRRTIYGVSERYYPSDVAKMSAMDQTGARAYAKTFYKTNFWDAFNCDAIPAPMDAVVFILAVNPGPGWVKAQKGIKDWKDLLLAAVDYYCDKAVEGQGKTPCCMEGNCKVLQDKCKRRFLIGWEHGRIVSLWQKYK